MAKDWQQGICNDKSGFLFDHVCNRVPSAECELCSKPVCDEHSRDVAGSSVCTGCEKKRMSRKKGAAGRRSDDDHYDHHDTNYAPYFYGGYYYAGYHDSYYNSSRGDRDDFREADAESLSDETGESFESDMSES